MIALLHSDLHHSGRVFALETLHTSGEASGMLPCTGWPALAPERCWAMPWERVKRRRLGTWRGPC